MLKLQKQPEYNTPTFSLFQDNLVETFSEEGDRVFSQLNTSSLTFNVLENLLRDTNVNPVKQVIQ